MNDSIELNKDDRGFKATEPIEGSYADEVFLKESSVAFNPHIWLMAKQADDVNLAIQSKESSTYTDVMVHLPVAKARQLRDALDYMLKNHYYGNMSEGDYDYDPEWWEKENAEAE
jgi:hypothetical protein